MPTVTSTINVPPAHAGVKTNLSTSKFANGHANGDANDHTTADKSYPSASRWNLDADGRFKDYPGGTYPTLTLPHPLTLVTIAMTSDWVAATLADRIHLAYIFLPDISQLLIPAFAGASTITLAIQWSTMIKYLALAIAGLGTFYTAADPQLKVAGVSILFPGAGFLAVGGIGGAIGFTVTLLLLPLCLFAWFGAGGLAFPIADWVFSGVLAVICTGDTVVESSPIITVGLVATLYTYLKTKASGETNRERDKRERRNEWLQTANKDWEVNSQVAATPGSRELSLEQLRYIQHTLELAMQDLDDWEGFTIIDQFQPAALRYQLYEFVNTLGVYQCIYSPNFHGYLSGAMRNSIEKSLTPKVLGYWKWESLWGKFTTDYDPVIKDNIMVTGFLLLALGVYQSNTGDDHYTKKGSLNMQITDKISYKNDMHSLYRALINNWDDSKFVLYPCEPNWIYSMCNLEGMAAATVYDRLFQSKQSSRVMKKFYKHFEEDFFTPGGSCIPIKSSLTGFTIPGICGVMGDCANALLCSPIMPTLAKRMWLITRKENVQEDESGQIKIINLKGADNIDGSNYKPAVYGPYSMFAPAAAEWGDTRIAKACLEVVDREAPLETNQATGAKYNKGVSTTTQALVTRARILQGGDWATTVAKGPPKNCLDGPILDSCSYPEVLVAKAFSHTSKDLELVLYPGVQAGTFSIGITRLQPEASYLGQNGERFVADTSGNAMLDVIVSERTQIHIKLAH